MRFKLTEQLPDGRTRRLIDPAALHAAAVLKQREREQFRRAQGGSLSPGDRLLLLRAWESRCPFCGRVLTWGSMTVEHLRPIGKGGTGRLANLAAACSSCNSEKNCRTAEQWGRPEVAKRARSIASKVAGAWAGDWECWAWLRALCAGIEIGKGSVFGPAGQELK
jgi:5-methylcytosine-specific restriction endonuclease McrA